MKPAGQATAPLIRTVPILTTDWRSDAAQWTLPVGAQAGPGVKAGANLPVNRVVAAYDTALRPHFGVTSPLRAQVAIVCQVG